MKEKLIIFQIEIDTIWISESCYSFFSLKIEKNGNWILGTGYIPVFVVAGDDGGSEGDSVVLDDVFVVAVDVDSDAILEAAGDCVSEVLV